MYISLPPSPRHKSCGLESCVKVFPVLLTNLRKTRIVNGAVLLGDVKGEHVHNRLQQFLKFAGVGGLAFVLDFVLLIGFTELLHIHPVISAGFAFTVSIVFNYVASMRYVFTHRDDLSRKREFAAYIFLSVIGLAVNELIMYWGVSYTSFDYRLVKLFAALVVTGWNFYSRRRWIDAN